MQAKLCHVSETMYIKCSMVTVHWCPSNIRGDSSHISAVINKGPHIFA